jgi:hypothetical protein
MAWSKFLDPEQYVIGIGTILAGVLGICWVVFALARKSWTPSDSKRTRTWLVFSCAVVTGVASLASLVVALLFAFENGFTIDLPIASSSGRARGAWLLWFFPTLACLLSGAALWVATEDARMMWNVLQGGEQRRG